MRLLEIYKKIFKVQGVWDSPNIVPTTVAGPYPLHADVLRISVGRALEWIGITCLSYSEHQRHS